MSSIPRPGYWIPLALVAALWVTGCAGTGQTDPDAEEAAMSYLQLGIHHMRSGDLQEAKDHLERSLHHDSNQAMTHATMALLYEQLDDESSARRHYRRALRIDGDDPALRNNYGTFLCRTGEHEEAVEEFVEAAENRLYQTPEVAWNNAGTCMRQAGEHSRAREYFRKAADADEEYAEPLWQLAQLAYDEGEFLQARGFFQRLEERAELGASALLLGVKIEDSLGDSDAAEEYASRLRQEHGDTDEIRELSELGYER